MPVYSVWLAYSTFMGMKSGLAGMGGAGAGQEQGGGAAESKRQKKMEKRGARGVQYR